MSKVQFTGRLYAVLAPETGISSTTGKPWMRQTFVFEIPDERFPKKIAVTTFSDSVAAQFQSLQPGMDINVTAYVESNESRTTPGRWFTELRGVSAYVVSTTQAVQQYQQAPQGYQQPQPQQYQQPQPQQYQQPRAQQAVQTAMQFGQPSQPQPPQMSQKQFVAPPQPQTNDQRFVQQYQQGMQQPYQPQPQQQAAPVDFADLPF
jgi:hypothetical protein